MWEWAETLPIVIWRDIPGIIYNTDETLYDKMLISPKEDLFWELLKPLIN